ncbi:hypothetical protein FA13DRAFT_1750557 [Coprinellus micaceus]|uniref:Uncharacterized protein n=1 Tax=Coprinellus micaceus TaxID=71717 RepID=A0A4Y7R6T9_COPMI|nr:hypothetical protein FA13DRAFT_1750557 [Coprinellus micaceus]
MSSPTLRPAQSSSLLSPFLLRVWDAATSLNPLQPCMSLIELIVSDLHARHQQRQ